MRAGIVIAALFVISPASAQIPACSSFHQSGPIVVNQDYVRYQNVVINSTSGAAVNFNGHSGVGIMNSVIHHKNGDGIYISGGSNNWIANSVIINDGAPVSGPTSSPVNSVNIYCNGSPGLILRNVMVQDGSSGVQLVNCPYAQITDLEGKNERGPYPYGQLVQFSNGSNHGMLSNFYDYNDPAISYPEDNISIYQSNGVMIAGGLIDGNNSINGVGVQSDQSATNVSVTDVQAIHQNNGCFSSYGASGTYNINYASVGCRDMTSFSYRGEGASGGIPFVGQPPGGTGSVFYWNAAYFNIPSGSVFYSGTPMSEAQASKIDFHIRTIFHAIPPCQ